MMSGTRLCGNRILLERQTENADTHMIERPISGGQEPDHAGRHERTHAVAGARDARITCGIALALGPR